MDRSHNNKNKDLIIKLLTPSFRSFFVNILLSIFIVFTAMACNSNTAVSNAEIPTSRSNAWWQQRHQDILSTDKSNVKLLFLGDSIIQ